MDIVALFAAIFDIALSLPGGRITVEDRYEMKKKVRELKRRERQERETSSQTTR
jgi:hypothetical protein